MTLHFYFAHFGALQSIMLAKISIEIGNEANNWILTEGLELESVGKQYTSNIWTDDRTVVGMSTRATGSVCALLYLLLQFTWCHHFHATSTHLPPLDT